MYLATVLLLSVTKENCYSWQNKGNSGAPCLFLERFENISYSLKTEMKVCFNGY